MEEIGGSSFRIADNLVALTLEGNLSEMESVFLQPDVLSFAEENSWSITSAMLEKLADQFSTDQLLSLDFLLDKLVQYGKPKEMVFALLECCQAFHSTQLFTTAITHLSHVLMKLPISQSSLDIVTESVHSHIKGMPWTTFGEGYQLVEADDEDSGVKVLNTDSVIDIASVVSAICQQLIVPLSNHWKEQLNGHHKDVLIQFLLKLLNYPLLYIFHQDLISTITECFDQVHNCLKRFVPTLTTLFKEDHTRLTTFTMDNLLASPRSNALVEDDDQAGLANLAYMILCKNYDSFPQVYTHQYRFILLLPYLSKLTTMATDSIVNFKTQALVMQITNNIEDMSIDTELAQMAAFRGLISYCYWCMQYAEINCLRKKAMLIFKTLHGKLDDDARANVYRWVLRTCSSPEVLSHLYSLVKDYIHKHWATTSSHIIKTCNGLLSLVFAAPEEEKEGDIVADLNKISSAINVAIYLVLRDKQRASPFTNQMSEYIYKYLQPVGECLRSELKHQQKTLEESAIQEDERPALSIEVGGKSITADSQLEREMTKSVVSKLELVLFNHKYLTELLS